MIAKPTRSTFIFSLATNALTFGSSIVVLPLILRFLSREEVGVWFVFTSLLSLAQLIDMGFQPTLSRNISYAYCGALSLRRKGLPIYAQNENKPNISLLQRLVDSSKNIYMVAALSAFTFLILVGSGYIYSLVKSGGNVLIYLMSWFILVLGSSINLYFGYHLSILQGCGFVASASKAGIASKLFFIISSTLLLVSGAGLFGISFAMAGSAVVSRISSSIIIRRQLPYLVLSKRPRICITDRYFRLLWHNAKRIGVVQIGGYLIQRSSILIAASALGASTSADYSLTITIANLISTLSQVYSNINLPYMTKLRLAADKLPVKRLYIRMSAVSILTSLALFSLLIIFGNPMLAVIRANAHLLDTPMLCAITLVFTLEAFHSVSAAYLTTTNHIPFVKSALFSGICVLILSSVLVTPYGVVGLILAQASVQLLYNNWRWPLDALRDISSLPQLS